MKLFSLLRTKLFPEEFEVQCEVVMGVVLEVPSIVYHDVQERNWIAALASWQECKETLADTMQHLRNKRVSKL